VYAKGASSSSLDRSGFGEALQAAKTADVIIVVVGETGVQNGEARSRTGLGLPGVQQALVEQLQATGKPLVVVLMGRPMAVPWIAEHVPAILEGWSLGVEMGNALADVLFGARNPSGKLPISIPRNVGQVPIYYDHKPTGRPPASLDPYTSKYIDVPWTPLYPFGYGLSYTTFKYDAPRLSATRIEPADSLIVRVKVQNTGQRAGEEVVQLYLRDDVASVTRPVQALRGFARVSLRPGAAQEVSFTLDKDDFALLDQSMQRVVEAGTFTVMVGGNSSDVQTAHFEVAHSLNVGKTSAIPRFMR
jgi:beta-glucosidase